MRNVLISICCAVIVFFSSQAFAAFVFLKNGSILKGNVVGDSARSITLRIEGKNRVVPRGRIMRIVYTKIYMGKVFVRFTDGRGIELYLVDEDRDSYTFRRALYKPKEMKAKRDDVLFIARKNPTGLKGQAGTTEIMLKWNPPYNKVIKYYIYMRLPGKKFKKIGESSGRGYRVAGLKSNSRYSFRVTAIDTDKYESLPSNVLKATTKNILPLAPRGLACRLSKKGGTVHAALTWEAASDPDGVVKGYYVYRVEPSGSLKVSPLLKGTAFTVKMPAGRVTFFSVKALDDKGGLSTESGRVSTRLKVLPEVSISPGYILPLGRFGELYSMGVGGTAGFAMGFAFMRNLNFGVETGAYYMQGKGNAKMALIAPLYLTAGYDFEFFNWLRLRPRLSLGVAWHYSSYTDNITGVDESDWEIEPQVRAGLRLIFMSQRNINFFLEPEFTLILESTPLIFLSFNAGTTYRFGM